MPSAYWGDRQIWDTRVNNHIDRKGRVWLTASVRGLDNPASRAAVPERCSLAAARLGSDNAAKKINPRSAPPDFR
jgi:hypothetical protein